MVGKYKIRRTIAFIFFLIFSVYTIISNTPEQSDVQINESKQVLGASTEDSAIDALKNIAIKGRAPKTGYDRAQFGGDWLSVGGCDTRNIILNRDLKNVVANDSCEVISGTLNDPYSGKAITFKRGSDTSGDVQIDHVVALSDAWQKGAQQMTAEDRKALANDPLELLAVDGPTNMQKSDGDAATWIPPNKAFRCQYVARQIAVKQKYNLWMTQAEHNAISKILNTCPSQRLPSA